MWADVFERILDKGIAVDSSQRAAPGGIDLKKGHVRIVVTSIETPFRIRGDPSPDGRTRTPEG